MQFFLTSLRGKEYFAKLNQCQEPEPEPESLEKKPGAGAAWEKNQEPEPLEKKSGAGARAVKKFAGFPGGGEGRGIIEVGRWKVGNGWRGAFAPA